MRRSHRHSSASESHNLLHKKMHTSPGQEHVATKGWAMHTCTMSTRQSAMLQYQPVKCLAMHEHERRSAGPRDRPRCCSGAADRLWSDGSCTKRHRSTEPAPRATAHYQEPFSGAASFAIHSLSAAAHMSRSVLLKLN